MIVILPFIACHVAIVSELSICYIICYMRYLTDDKPVINLMENLRKYCFISYLLQTVVAKFSVVCLSQSACFWYV